MIRFGTGFTVNAVFFTHFHADHYLGIIGFLRTLGMSGREESLTLYGPAPAKRLLHQAIHPLAGLFGDFVDRLDPTSRDPHEQQVKTPKQRTRHQRGDRFKQKKAGGDDYGDEEPCREVAKWRQEKKGKHVDVRVRLFCEDRRVPRGKVEVRLAVIFGKELHA